MNKNGNWFLVKDRNGVDLEIGDSVQLVYNEYSCGQQFVAGQLAQVVDAIMDGRGIRVEVKIHKTRIIVDQHHLAFCGRLKKIGDTKFSKVDVLPVCPVCRSKLSYLHGADYCDSCRMPLWEIQQGLAKRPTLAG